MRKIKEIVRGAINRVCTFVLCGLLFCSCGGAKKTVKANVAESASRESMTEVKSTSETVAADVYSLMEETVEQRAKTEDIEVFITEYSAPDSNKAVYATKTVRIRKVSTDSTKVESRAVSVDSAAIYSVDSVSVYENLSEDTFFESEKETVRESNLRGIVPGIIALAVLFFVFRYWRKN
ncbi:MAG: hypothetical protein LBJ17_01700 [Dysgonamonadaceae bacterium]|jgi:uncharacterized Zn finger protein (UPF0148 family)|nr:hypothetical protein [Dysgonamonadaceae bacterium]